MALTSVDRALLQRCLQHDTGAWNDFVDRFLGLIYHTIHHTAHLRSVTLRPEDTEDVAAEIPSVDELAEPVGVVPHIEATGP